MLAVPRIDSPRTEPPAVRTDMSAPDSWESLADPNVPPGQGGDVGGRFAQMNINARPFVPNIHAHPFVPVPRYGAPYGYPPMAGNIQPTFVVLQVYVHVRAYDTS